jgi:hypothetical protein
MQVEIRWTVCFDGTPALMLKPRKYAENASWYNVLTDIVVLMTMSTALQ